MSRLKIILLNSGVNLTVSLLNIVISFVSRSIFIAFLGEKFLGLNGLFSSILSMLSLAELGIGTSIVYFLYQPLANKDFKTTVVLMNLYKKIYRFIGFAVFIIGMMLVPFLDYFVGSTDGLGNIRNLYILFLANSVVSYFFTYKRSLLIADQQGYIVTINDFIFRFLLQIFQIVTLIYTQSFYLYLVCQIIITIAGNISISWLADLKFPQLRSSRSNQKLNQHIISKLKKNIVGNFSNKVGSVAVNGMDNIFISMFVSLGSVGIYSNYLMITMAAQSVLLNVSNSITATIGNIAVNENVENIYSAFKKHQFLNMTMAYFASSIMAVGLDSFIKLWLGSEYVFGAGITIVIILNFFINRLRNSGNVFIEALGLAWHQRYKPVVEAIMNLSLSLIFLMLLKLEVVGVVLSTLVTSALFAAIFEGHIVFKYALNKSMNLFFKANVYYIAVFLMDMMVSRLLLNYLSAMVYVAGWGGLVLKCLIGLIVSGVIYVAAYHKDENLKFISNILNSKFKKTFKAVAK